MDLSKESLPEIPLKQQPPDKSINLPPPTKSNKFIFALIIGLGLAVIGVGFYVLRFENSLSRQPQSTPFLNAAPSPAIPNQPEQQPNPTPAIFKPSPTPTLIIKGEKTSDIVYTENNRYYEISGRTEDELRNGMNAKRFSCYGGEAYDSCTDWTINWSYPYENVNGKCSTGPIKVTVDVQFTWPKWDNPGNSPLELKDKWNRYLTSLKTHEDGHKENAVNGGREILQTLKALPSFPSCPDLNNVANQKGNEILDKIRANDVTYDGSTNHGESQGAIFP